MAMIFTEQENIDDVIFFPMMRPALSPLDQEIYKDKLEPPAPDLVLTFEGLKELCDLGALKLQSENLTIHPHITAWEKEEKRLYSGQVEIEGFFENRRLLVTGFSIKNKEDEFFSELETYLHTKYPHKITSKITVSETILLRKK